MKRGMQGMARRAQLADGSERAATQPCARISSFPSGGARSAASPLSEVAPKGKAHRGNFLRGSIRVGNPRISRFRVNGRYFDKRTRLRVLGRSAPMLESDGLLFTGHSGSRRHAAHRFAQRGRTGYRLAGRPGRS